MNQCYFQDNLGVELQYVDNLILDNLIKSL
jgi:hypothetical protein